MRGWIAVGTFLAQLQAVDAEHGLDLVVLNSICDRARLPESLVHEILIRFASPKKMAYGILATTIRRAEQAHMAKLPMLVEVQAKLTAMNQFAGRLEPTKASVFAAWQLIVLKRIRGLLHLVIGPRIAHISEGKPLLTAATSQNLPREASEGIKLNYLFEVVQLERRVPLARYTGHNDNEPDFLEITSGQASNVVLRRENQELKEKVVSLAKEKSELEVKNRELAAKLERAVAAWDGFVGGTTTQEALLGASNSSNVYERALHPITLSSPSPALPERHPSQGMSHLQPDHADLRRQRRSGFIGLEELQGLGSDVAQAYVTGDETFVMSGRRDKAAEMLNGESSSE